MLKKCKSPDSDQIPAELIQKGEETSVSEFQKGINSICNEEKLPVQMKESFSVPKQKKE
jgi:hypothetical protein